MNSRPRALTCSYVCCCPLLLCGATRDERPTGAILVQDGTTRTINFLQIEFLGIAAPSGWQTSSFCPANESEGCSFLPILRFILDQVEMLDPMCGERLYNGQTKCLLIVIFLRVIRTVVLEFPTIRGRQKLSSLKIRENAGETHGRNSKRQDVAVKCCCARGHLGVLSGAWNEHQTAYRVHSQPQQHLGSTCRQFAWRGHHPARSGLQLDGRKACE